MQNDMPIFHQLCKGFEREALNFLKEAQTNVPPNADDLDFFRRNPQCRIRIKRDFITLPFVVNNEWINNFAVVPRCKKVMRQVDGYYMEVQPAWFGWNEPFMEYEVTDDTASQAIVERMRALHGIDWEASRLELENYDAFIFFNTLEGKNVNLSSPLVYMLGGSDFNPAQAKR